MIRDIGKFSLLFPLPIFTSKNKEKSRPLWTGFRNRKIGEVTQFRMREIPTSRQGYLN
jgi:hypothetical protein